jgi:hypothetical protein
LGESSSSKERRQQQKFKCASQPEHFREFGSLDARQNPKLPLRLCVFLSAFA